MTTRPFATHDLPANSFPFTIEFLRSDNNEIVHTIEVTGPGVVDIPALGREVGCTLWTRVTYADGQVAEGRPDA